MLYLDIIKLHSNCFTENGLGKIVVRLLNETWFTTESIACVVSSAITRRRHKSQREIIIMGGMCSLRMVGNTHNRCEECFH